VFARSFKGLENSGGAAFFERVADAVDRIEVAKLTDRHDNLTHAGVKRVTGEPNVTKGVTK
jgi:hypothetical protein